MKIAPARRFPLLVLGVFTLALALRLALLWELHERHISSVLVIDAKVYDQWARRIAAGDWLGTGVFYQAPLYPYLMGLAYRLFGAEPLKVQLLQAALGACSCALLAVTGRRQFGPAAGVLAGALLAVSPTAVFNDAQIQKSSLDLFLVTLLLLALSGAVPGSRPGRWLGCGAALGALALTRENALVLLPVLLWWAWRLWRGRGRELAVRLALLTAGVALPLAPVAARNYVVGGEPVLTTSLFGMVLYMGNNPGATGGYQPLVPGRSEVALEQRDAVSLAERALGRRLSTREVSRYWAGRAVAFARESPGAWLRLTGRKALLLFNRTELCDTYDQYSYADWSRVLRLLNPLVHFGVLVPLAVLGVVLTWREGGAARLLLAVVAVYGASVVAFFVLARYRFPLAPALTLFAAAGAVRAAAAVRAARHRELAVACLAAAVAAVLANWPLVPRSELHGRTVMRNNVAVGLLEQKRYAEALPYALEAIALDPHFVEGYFNAGVILQNLGRPEQSADYLGRGARIQPAWPELQCNLGLVLSQLGRSAEAIAAFEQALRADPGLALARSRLNIEREQLRRGGQAPAAPR